jgi:hypothetical protein
MKKYKIRVRVLPENVCCGFITEVPNLYDAFRKIEMILGIWGFTDFDFISIGEL